ncbi:PREDICTED: uncharacterized protein LOC100486535 isoform X3 [Pelobates cultripes]|uniref:PREDICTED: uncharacterized protein LOC100486535 isoform X3 n=1 Tax=Pelobates cultripes TaxID=61616 RepID=A0AAD1T0Q6_PELCU|nr:PREDICTED: uncharacterized protein LOC100486535 isoform X3 [Pelobates cultripes]
MSPVVKGKGMLLHKKDKFGFFRGKDGKEKKRGRGRPCGSTNKNKMVQVGAVSFKMEREKHGSMNGISCQSASTEIMIGIKRGRGRPRKIELEPKPEIPKRPRGRPKKIQKVDEDVEEPVPEYTDISPEMLKSEYGHQNEVDPFQPKLHRQNVHPGELEASTLNAGPMQITHEIHPPGVSHERGWAREALVENELLPPDRETHGSQYPGWEAQPDPSHVSWVPGGVIDSDNNTVTHWVVEESQAPRPPIYTEGTSLDQNEYREDLLRGLADFRYQLTRELAAARGEMREGAELVRSAIDGVSAEIRRLGLLLQPLITVLTSGNILQPQQNSTPLNTLLRHQQDTPPDDPPNVSQHLPHFTNPSGLSQQGSFPVETMFHTQSDTSSQNMPGLHQRTANPTRSTPQQDLPCSQTQNDLKELTPVLDCSPPINKLAKDTSHGNTLNLPKQIAMPTASPSPPKHDLSLSQSPDHDPEAKNPVLDCPTIDNNLCLTQDTAPALLVVPTAMTSVFECPTAVSRPSSISSPVLAEDTETSFPEIPTVENFNMVSQSSEIMSDNSVLSQSAATLSQDSIQISQVSTMMSEDSAVTLQPPPTSPRAGTAPLQTERDVALMILQDSESPVSLTEFPTIKSSDTGYLPC